MIEVQPQVTERAFLVAVERDKTKHWEVQDSLRELQELAVSAGAEVLDRVSQKLASPTPSHYIGKGKAEEIAEKCHQQKANLVIFDDDLSPAQNRNLESTFKLKVLDRTKLILDIFAQRARTREGRLQIELAQLQYLLPRLTRMWTHLSRQSGGIGTRGPGETQLEVDRRRVQEKISKLIKELELVQKQRATQRQGRKRYEWPILAIIGYTNAGKSTLLNRLTGSQVLAEDKLFATLDPTTRKFLLPNKQTILLTDTVGFLRKLPHHLVEAFKATLEEVVMADILLHVVDVSHPAVDEQIEAVNQVLLDLNAANKPMIIALNKVDAVANNGVVERLCNALPNSVPISGLTGEGLTDLFFLVERTVQNRRSRLTLKIPHSDSWLVAKLHSQGNVVEQNFHDDFVEVIADVPPTLTNSVQPYVVVS